MKPYYAKLGSVSHGTLRPEDLIPAFLDTLESLVVGWMLTVSGPQSDRRRDAHHAKELLKAIGRIEERADRDSYYTEDWDDTASDLEYLTNRLNEFAPPYCYFGAHPGDGSDFGFWLYEDWQQQAKDDGVTIVNDLSEVPLSYKEGLLFHVNDHGNVTLYHRDRQTGDSVIFEIV